MTRKMIIEAIMEVFLEIGIPAHIKGFRYLRTAVILVIENPCIMNAVTKKLYPAIAERHKTTPSCVERGIRHAIETAWCRGNLEMIHDIFGYTVDKNKGKPTNKEFIALIADRLMLQLEEGEED